MASRTVSIVVEWENVQLAEQGRCREMLSRVAQEVRGREGDAVSSPVELLVCLDENEIDLDRCRSVVLAALADDEPRFRTRFLPLAGAQYYELKNFGADQATGDLVVYIDSDVIPEPGWLSNLLGPFADEQVSVVAGHSFIEPATLYSRTFALTWMFPLRSDTGAVLPARRFFANNVAFRRELLERFPFPSVPGASRGQCQQLGSILIANGSQIVHASAARVSHPPPNGARHFLTRAVAQGRDRVLLAGPGSHRTPGATARQLRSDMHKGLRSIVNDGLEVGLSWPAIPVAAAIATLFALCSAIGEIATMVHRSFMVEHFQL